MPNIVPSISETARAHIVPFRRTGRDQSRDRRSLRRLQRCGNSAAVVMTLGPTKSHLSSGPLAGT
jgi:hypothetical protein